MTTKPGLSITMKTPPAYKPNSLFFARLRSNSQAYHLFVGWMETRLEVRTISQMQIVRKPAQNGAV